MPVTVAQIADLRNQVGAIERSAQTVPARVLPFGVVELDRALPGGGLRRGALHEARDGGAGANCAAAATLWWAGVAARLDGPVLWVAVGTDLFAPGLACAGLGPERVLHAEARDARGVLPLVEEGLRTPALAAVVAEARGLSLAASRRLQLAAERSGVTCLILLRWAKAAEPSAAVTRWRIGSAPSAALACPGVGRARLAVTLERCRGAQGGSWIVEAPDAQGRLAMAADVADRSLGAVEPGLVVTSG